jgi:hypothetical protein
MAEWPGMVRNKGEPMDGSKAGKSVRSHSNGLEWMRMPTNG